jgi:glutamate racemase
MPKIATIDNGEQAGLSNGMKIGFFDSGLGGLTVLKAVVKELPSYDYEFYGDTANLPYGDKTEEEIYELTKRGMEHLFSRGCLLVVIACNTASAETLRRLQDTFLPEKYKDRKILGVIIPMVETVLAAKAEKVLLLATVRTVESGKYQKELEKHAEHPQLITVATPELVPLIEKGEIGEAVVKGASYIQSYLPAGIDTVILGCTHYGLLKEGLASVCPSVRILSADELIPAKLAAYLHEHTEIASLLSQSGTRTVYLTQHTPHYDRFMAEILGGVMLHD